MAALSHEEVEHFLNSGYIVVRGAFRPEAAAEATRPLWTRLGYDPNDRATWAQHRIHMPTLGALDVRTFAPRAYDAICQLCGGEERIAPPRWGDGFIVNLGADDHEARWQPAGPECPGWHKDGDFFRHFLDSPEQGLLTIVLWSDVVHRGGPTYLAADSVGPIARFLAARPEGVLPNGFGFADRVRECQDFREATGEAGDVFLMHPYLLHASSLNPLRAVRIITNPPVHLKEPMCFDRPDGAYSPVERAVLRGLGVERLAFTPTAPRERIVPERERIQARMREEEQARLATASAPAESHR